MGLYDRPYYQDDHQPSGPMLSTKPIFVILIVINVAIYFGDFVFGGKDFLVSRTLSVTSVVRSSGSNESEEVRSSGGSESEDAANEAGVSGRGMQPPFSDTLTRPWLWWKFLTYGFAHDPKGISHLVFNMLGLFFFGRAVEDRMGRFEFLRFYLVAIVLGGIVFAARSHLAGNNGLCMGASGAVCAVVMLFIFWYPQQELYLMFVLPVKAWVVGVIMIATNLLGLGAENVAFDVHLAGIGFAALYYYRRWNLAFLSPSWLQSLFKKRPQLKIHDPDRANRKEKKDANEADRILQKIHDQGEDSLTKAERKTLERHSRRLREKK